MSAKLVFLPGWGIDVDIWQTIADHFSDLLNQQVMLLNLPLQSNMAAIIDDLSHSLPEQASLVAWSFSGLIAMRLCQRYPHRFQRCVLVASTPKFVADSAWPGVSQQLASAFSQQASHNFERLQSRFTQLITHPSPAPLLLKRKEIKVNNNILINQLNIIFNVDLRDIFSQIAKQLHIILGGRDAIVPAEVSSQLVAATSVDVIPSAGHAPFLSHEKDFITILESII